MNHLEELQDKLQKVPRYIGESKLLYPADSIKLKYVKCIIDKILTLGKIKSAYDFGCGTGIYVQELINRGIMTLGFDGNLGIKSELKTNAENICFTNLEYSLPKDFLPKDLVLSIEFAEHISKAGGELFYDNITKLSKQWIVITASPEKGEFHLNPQPRQYWIDNIEKRKTHIYLKNTSNEFMDYFNKTILVKDGLRWFRRDLMIFKRIKS